MTAGTLYVRGGKQVRKGALGERAAELAGRLSAPAHLVVQDDRAGASLGREELQRRLIVRNLARLAVQELPLLLSPSVVACL